MLPQKAFAILRRPWRPVWLVILLVVIIMTLNGYPPPARAASPAEIASLTSIYNNLGGVGWTDSTNWLDPDPCDATPWYGVTCDGLGNVTRVDLPNNNLTRRVGHNIKFWSEITRFDPKYGDFGPK